MMDTHSQSQYCDSVRYYKYLVNQRNNPIDLTNCQADPNNSIHEFAKILFNRSKKNLDLNLSGLLIDDTMETADIFCMLMELMLFGLDILTDGKYVFFDLISSCDDIIYTLKNYLKSAGFDIKIHEICVAEDEICLYRDRDDYYCEMVPKPPPYLCHPGWYVLSYRLIDNDKFEFTKTTSLEKFKAFFISKQNRIFTITFKYNL